MSKEDRDKEKFKVTDRRSFTTEGQPREPSDTAASSDASTESSETQETRQPEASTGPSGEREVPPIDFSSFIISLATSAMVHLGEVPDPAAGKVRENLDAAKQMVDLLGILEEKTKGNLTGEEDRLLEEILYELRMKFMAKSNVIQL